MSEMDRERRLLGDDDIESIMRSVGPADFERIAPPPQVLTNLLAELSAATTQADLGPEADADVRSLRPAPTRRHVKPQRFRSARLLQLAAAVLLLGGLTVFVTRLAGDDATTREFASAMMTDDGLPVSTTATAEARLVCDDDGGECAVEVDLTSLPDAGANDLELWVINDDVTDMYSLGLVTHSGRFALPFGVTAAAFPIVDISVEPRDGVATHSGQSVLRGTFEQG